MDWLQTAFIDHTPLQAVIVLSAIIALGLGLGKIRICGISLGTTWVFFAGIIAGHAGLSIDPAILGYAQSFGLAIFVYELGLKVGPGFFSSFRTGGVKLNLYALALVAAGTAVAVLLGAAFGVPMPDVVGIIAGATTNTPSLGAAQQALQQMGQSSSTAALSCAVTYPLGVVGVILAIVLLRKISVRPSDLTAATHDDDHTYATSFRILNPGIYGKTLREVHSLIHCGFVASRLWRGGELSIPGPDTTLMANDRLLVVTNDKDVDLLTMHFGKHESTDWNSKDIDWDTIDRNLVSRHIFVSRPEINGKKLGSLRLRNTYGINISRVLRSGVTLLATPELVLQLGDRLTIVGDEQAISRVEKLFGNTETALKDPNLACIFVGLLVGLLLGTIPFYLPGVAMPIRLGLAGGPIVVGILMGRFGPQLKLVTYTTRSANLMLRGIGLSLFLACLGLDAGAEFLDALMRAEGLIWIGVGFVVTFVPSLLSIWAAMRLGGLDFGSACGMTSGAMANPMALDYAGATLPGDNAAVSYATVYPLSMFSRVVIAQLLILIFA